MYYVFFYPFCYLSYSKAGFIVLQSRFYKTIADYDGDFYSRIVLHTEGHFVPLWSITNSFKL